jgi:hypothetical protein
MTAARDTQILNALLEAMVPTGGPFALGASDPAVAARFVDYVRSQHRSGGTALRILLRCLEWSSAVLRGSRFTRLEPEAREAFLASLAQSRVALPRHQSAALKLTVMLHFYSDPRVEAAIGYDRDYLRGKLRAGPNRDAHLMRIDATPAAARAA